MVPCDPRSWCSLPMLESAVAKRQARRKKEVSKPRDPNGIRQLSAELRDVADRLDHYAENMEEMGIETIRPLTGNFHLAVEKLRIFAASQVLSKLVAEAARLGVDAHEVFADD